MMSAESYRGVTTSFEECADLRRQLILYATKEHVAKTMDEINQTMESLFMEWESSINFFIAIVTTLRRILLLSDECKRSMKVRDAMRKGEKLFGQITTYFQSVQEMVERINNNPNLQLNSVEMFKAQESRIRRMIEALGKLDLPKNEHRMARKVHKFKIQLGIISQKLKASQSILPSLSQRTISNISAQLTIGKDRDVDTTIAPATCADDDGDGDGYGLFE